MKIQKSTLLELTKLNISNRKYEYKCFQPKDKSKLQVRIFERFKKSNKKQLLNLCELNNFESQTFSSSAQVTINSNLARTFIPVEITKQHET